MSIKKSFRVKKTSDFDAIFKAKNSFANRAFILYQRENGLKHFRLGLSVSKKLGNAVTRNRIKRRMREIVRKFSDDLIESDFVIIARKGVEDYKYDMMEKNLTHLLTKSNIIRNQNEKEKN